MSKSPIKPADSKINWRMLEHLFDAIAVVDTARKVHYANARFRKLGEFPEGEANHLIDISEYLEVPSSCWDALRSPGSLNETTPIIHSVPFNFRDGARGFAQVVIDRIETPSDPQLFLCTLHDITFEIQSKHQLDENERTIADLRRRHAESEFLWRLSMETPIYIEPYTVFATIAKKLKEELGFQDACFLQLPDLDDGQPAPVLSDMRVGSRLRQVAQSLIPSLRKKQSRIEVMSTDYAPFGTFWVTNFRPKLEKPFFLLASSEQSARESNRRAFLEPLATQITAWLDNRSMYLSSITDSLTGLFNRRHFDSRFNVECLLARERQVILSLILIDIDFFKKINDSFGHQVGDLVLQSMSQALKSVLRTTDITARVGGEEFGVLLFDTSPADAVVAAEKIRAKIAETPVPLPGFNQSIHITVSCGIAGFTGSHDTSEAVFRAADEALYKAKATGRNRIVLADSTEQQKTKTS